jgi:hypothetical protein
MTSSGAQIMKKNGIDHKTKEISIIKIFGWLFAVCVLSGMAFLLTSYQVGPVKKMRGKVLLEYVGIIKDKRSDAELIRALDSSDEIEQFNAVTAMAHRRYSRENAEALLNYLKSDSGTRRVKNIAVWALGELHAPEAKEFLYSLKGNENFSQYEVDKAIKKIEGKIPKPFWRK